MERIDNQVTNGTLKATIPDDISMLSVFTMNDFIHGGNYRDDGWIYVDNKPIRKWFRKVDSVLLWFPKLRDLIYLQDKYDWIYRVYRKYNQEVYRPIAERLIKAKGAHARVTHKYKGNNDPWWFFTASEEGIGWDWVDTPAKPKNLALGDEYYRKSHRGDQLGSRVYLFRRVLEQAIASHVSKIKGNEGQILQFQLGEKIYWFERSRYSWNKVAFPSDDIITVKWEK